MGSGLRVWGLGLWVQSLGLGGFRVCGFGLGAQGLGFRVWVKGIPSGLIVTVLLSTVMVIIAIILFQKYEPQQKSCSL